MNTKFNHPRIKGLLRTAAAAACALPGIAVAEYGLNLPRGVTSLSRQHYDLHMLIFYICVAIGVVVFGVMFWAIFHYRKSRGAVAAQFSHSTTAELIWTTIPMVILIGMAVPATKALIAMESTGSPDMQIKITGYQWKWHYEYLDEDFGFFSSLDEQSNEARQLQSGISPHSVEHYLLEVDEPLVVPVGKKIRFLTTANDVIHSWWVPDLGWKRDAVPGFINSSWAVIDEPGVYRGQCAELCGRDHAFMPIVVNAVSEEDYREWVAEKKNEQLAAASEVNETFSFETLMTRGEDVYKGNCTACHQGNGQGIPGAFPALAGSAIATGDLEAHINIVLYGKAGTAMAAFGAQLSEADLAAVLTYERNAWGNDGLVTDSDTKMLQPADVATRLAAKKP